jgi:hypothetical protein
LLGGGTFDEVSVEIVNRGEVVGHLSDWKPDMWYIEGRFVPADSQAGARFAAEASALDLRAAFDDHSRGIRAQLRESPSDVGTTFVVMSLANGQLFGRRVFESKAVQWVLANVPE